MTDRTHYFCDPPYWKTAGYDVDFPMENYLELAEFARSIKRQDDYHAK